MLLNHIKIAFRNLLRDNIYSVINVGGLAIGISTAVLLMLWVQDELSFDKFHSKADRIYRVNATFVNEGAKTTWQTTPAPVAYFANKDVPSIEAAGRISGEEGTTLFSYNGNKFPETNSLAYVDPDFFKVFDFPLLKGSSTNPF